MTGVWASAANVGYATYSPYSGGNKDNAICASGGVDYSNVTKLFNGLTWAAGGNLPASVAGCGSGDCGNASAAIATGGRNSSAVQKYTFIFNGSSWSTGNNLNVARRSHAGMARNVSSAIVIGGWVTGIDDVLISCEAFNGSTWSTIANYYAAIMGLAGGGNGAAAIAFGGYIGSTVYVGNANTFDGASWSAISALSMARYDLGGGGSSTQAIAFGGRDTIITNSTEEYNGAAWGAGGNLNTARRLVSGGLSGSGISVGGYTTKAVQTTETYSYPVPEIVRNASGSRNVSTERQWRLTPVVGTPIVLTTPTYDGSGQAVHPSVRYFPATFGGYKYIMGMTPYPNGNDDYENPSLLASNDTITWSVPNGITNPMAPMPSHHNCDCCLVYDGSTLYCYYVKQTTSAADGTIQRITITNDPITVGTNKACTGIDSTHLASPMVIRNGPTEWILWYVHWNNFELVRYISTDGLAWTGRTVVSCFTNGQPTSSTLVLWHFTGKKFGDKYLFVAVCYPAGGNNSQTELYYAVADLWDSHLEFSPTKILAKFSDWGTGQVYLSDLCQLENGTWRLFISAKTTGGVWRIGYADVALW